MPETAPAIPDCSTIHFPFSPCELASALIDGEQRLGPNDAMALSSVALARSPQSIVEIGAFKGCSTFILGRVAMHNGGNLVSIDCCDQPDWYQNIKKWGLSDHVTLLKEASPRISIDKIRTPIDLLFIDGDHSTFGCLCDFFVFWPHLSRNAFIVFHDTDSHLKSNEGVKVAVQFLRSINEGRLILVATTKGDAAKQDHGMTIFRVISQ